MPNNWTQGRPGRGAFSAKITRAVLRNSPTCQLQIPGVCTDTATQVDHVVSFAEAMQLGWSIEDVDDPSNAAAVCASCHKVKSQSEAQRGRQRAQAQRTPPPRQHPGLRPGVSLDRLPSSARRR